MTSDCYGTSYYGVAVYGGSVYGGDCRRRGGASVYSQVSLFTPGWRNERRVGVTGIQASWTINGAGRLSCLIPADTAPRDRDLKGMWVYWEHPTAGPWAGTIEDLPDDFGGATWEIGCASMAAMLGWRRGPRIDLPTRAPAGALARLALRTADRPARLWIDAIVAECVGPPILMEWRGDTVLSVFSALQQASGQEWRVTTASDRTTTLEWRQKVGRDVRATVLIADGYDVGGGRMESSIAATENDRLAVAGADPWARREAVSAEDAGSIRLYGRRQGPATPYPGLVTKASLLGAAQADVARLAKPAQPTSVVLVADNEAGHRNFALRVREGDTVKLIRGGQPTPLDFRVLTRSIDVGAGTLTLTGDASAEATGWERGA